MNPKYEDANKIINKHIFTILGVIVGLIIPVLLFAGDAWVNQKIEAKMGNYATKSEIVSIQKQISNSQIDRIQEDIFTIQDKQIDGLGTPSDSKKILRLEIKMKNIKEIMDKY